MTPLRRWLPVLLAMAWLASMAHIIQTRWSVGNDITKFLAESDDARLGRLHRKFAQSEATKTMILVIGSESGDRAKTGPAADAMADMLEADKEVAWVRRGWDPDQNKAIHDLYFPHRFDFANDDLDALEQQLTDAGLEKSAKQLVSQLRLPTSSLIKQLAPSDPLLLYTDHLRRLEQARTGPLDVVDGRFVTDDGQTVLFLATKSSPFEADTQGPLQAAITERFAQLDERAGGDLTMAQSAIARFALRAEGQIRGDITRISTFSMLGVIALFLILFRSPRLIVLSLVPLLYGVTTAMGMCLLIFGELHGLTLAFGASLLGVCIDYPIHLFTHHALYRGTDMRAMVAGVRPGLLLGALTTVAGFLGMGWASFPGIRQVAVFAAIGILAALITTLLVLPSLLPVVSKPVGSQRWLMREAEKLVSAMSRRRSVLVVLPLTAIVVMALGLPRLEYEDDVAALTEIDPELQAEEDHVRSLVSRMDGGRMVVALGKDDEQALLRNDEVHERLVEAVAAGEVAEFRSLHSFLWSQKLQAENRKRFCAREDLPGALDRAYVAQGLKAGSFEPFVHDFVSLCKGKPTGLDWPTLAASPLGEALGSMRLELGNEVAILTLVRGVEDLETLRERLAGMEDVVVFDQRSMMTEIYGRHRSKTIELVALGLLAVMVILFTRHGQLRPTLAACTPAILAAGMTLALLVLIGHQVTLLHVVALVLVLSMGVDYGVFLTESRGDPHEVAATMVSLLACCLSTVLSFGLLGAMDSPEGDR